MNNSEYGVFANDSTGPVHNDTTILRAYLITIFIVIVVGNSIVLLAIALSKNRHHSRMNFFIMHLAIADLSVGFLSVLVDLIWRLTEEWYAGNAMCKLVKYVQAVATYSSTYLLVSLSIDRLDAIARPLNFSGSTTRARLLTGTAWLLSLVFSLPMLPLYSAAMTDRDGVQCYHTVLIYAWHFQVYITPIALALFILPGTIIAACYIAIVSIIWNKSGRLIAGERVTKTTNGGEHKSSHAIYSSTTYSTRGVIPRAKIRTVKMTLIIVLTFVACWSPYFVYNLLDTFHLLESHRSVRVATFVQNLGTLNSALNPIIYGIFSTRICQNLRRLPLCGSLPCCGDAPDARRSDAAKSTFRYSAGSCTVLSEAHPPHTSHGARDVTRLTSPSADGGGSGGGVGGPDATPTRPASNSVHALLSETETMILMKHLKKDKMEVYNPRHAVGGGGGGGGGSGDHANASPSDRGLL